MELTGVIEEIFDVQEISDRFRKKEFIIRNVAYTDKDGKDYFNYFKCEFQNDGIDLLDGYSKDNTVTIKYELKGSKFEKNGRVMYFTNIKAFAIEGIIEVKKPKVEITKEIKQNNNSDDIPF